MEQRYNTRSPAVKRLMREAQELSEPTDQYFAQPLDDNLFEWHFTVRGPADSDFQNGIYHGRIILPMDYPMKPPSIIWLTPNGRFETNKKICLSISGHHPESWQPSWSIRTALLAIIGFMPTRAGGAIGSLDYKPEERKGLAKRSREWQCPSCGDVKNILLEPTAESSSTAQEAKDLAAQINFQGEKQKGKEESPLEGVAAPASETQSPASMPPLSATDTTSVPPSQTTPTAVPVPPAFMPWAYPTFPGSPLGTNMAGIVPPQGLAAMIPRFPYPPSHYPAGYPPPFYPPGFALPPGVGHFPCPYPPNITPSVPASSTANTTSSSSLSSPAKSNTQTTNTYTRTPMTTSFAPAAPPTPSTTSSTTPSTAISEASSLAKNDLMSQLLHTVKRVGSEDSTEVKETQEVVGGAKIEQGAVGGILEDAEVGCEEKAALDKSPGSNSELSGMENSKGNHSGTERDPTDLGGDDSSAKDAPPISDYEQRSGMERSMSGSTSDLERKSRNQGLPKSGLRQRQSATARIQDLGEEVAAGGPEPRQRIEASSGDTQPRGHNRLNLAANRLAARQRDMINEVREHHSPYDFTFFLMIVMSIVTVIILFNRLKQHIDWGLLFEDEF